MTLNEKYRYSYEFLYAYFLKNDIQLFRASYEWYNSEKKFFDYAWTYDTEGVWQQAYAVRPDLIYNKVSLTSENMRVIININNHIPFFHSQLFEDIINQKLTISLLFPNHCKKNYFIENSTSLEKALSYFSDSEQIVLKPTNLFGGQYVYIEKKADLLEKIKKDKPLIKNWIAQKFINSTQGIPGIMKGYHDMRIIIINGEIAFCNYRKPSLGNLISNINQGGERFIIQKENIPKKLLPLIHEVDEVFSIFRSRLYTIDIMFDEKGKPWIVELNTMPGMFFKEGEEKDMEILFKYFLIALQKEISLL